MSGLDPLLEEVLDKQDNHVATHDEMALINRCADCDIYVAIKAVMAIPVSQHLGNDGPRQKLAVDCYNMALSDIRSAIAEALGIEL